MSNFSHKSYFSDRLLAIFSWIFRFFAKIFRYLDVLPALLPGCLMLLITVTKKPEVNVNEHDIPQTLLALRHRLIGFFRRHNCRLEDAEDLAGDLITQVVASEGAMRFLAHQTQWITENGIPRPYFRQLYRLLYRFRRRSSQFATIPVESVCPTRSVGTTDLDFFAESLGGKQRQAFQLLRAGHTQTEAATIVGVDERTIRNWLARWHTLATSYEKN